MAERFTLDSTDGLFRWKINNKRLRAVKDKTAGSPPKPNMQPYHRITIEGKNYQRARLVYLWCSGKFPNTVDHIDGDTLNDAPVNLTSKSRSQIAMKMKKYRTNKSGVRGVRWVADRQCWRATIVHNRKTLTFQSKDKEDCMAWRADQELNLFGTVASGA